MKDVTGEVLEGDCLEQLKELEDCSVDMICTDPPYSISFMGLSWDKAVPSVEVWKECLRVLKPGGFAFVFSAARLDCLMMMGVSLSSAGFKTSFSPINWVYSQGFNKSANMGKMIDKRLGAEREIVGDNPTWREAKRKNQVYQTVEGGSAEHITAPATEEAKYFEGSYSGYQPKPCYEPVLVCMKPLSEKTYVDQALAHYQQRQEGETTVGPGVTWLDDGRIPTTENLDGGAYSEDRHPRAMTPQRKGERETTVQGEFVQPAGRFAPNLLVEGDVLQDGIRRASAKSTKKHGAYEGESKTGFLRGASHPGNQHGDAGSLSRFFDLDAWFTERVRRGRFAPNLLVESDVLNDGESKKSHGGGKASFGGIFGSGADVTDKTAMQRFQGDSGSLSRYFDLDAWYAARQEMLDALPDSVKKTFPFLYAPKPSPSEKQKGCEDIWVLKEDVPNDVVEKLTTKMRKWPGQYWWVDEAHYQKMPKTVREKWYRNGNAHVTVKPLKLMMYLVEIGSRQGDVVLDPYAGSGTTGVAAQLRSRDFILIERDPRWAEISRRRLHATPQPLFHRKMR